MSEPEPISGTSGNAEARSGHDASAAWIEISEECGCSGSWGIARFVDEEYKKTRPAGLFWHARERLQWMLYELKERGYLPRGVWVCDSGYNIYIRDTNLALVQFSKESKTWLVVPVDPSGAESAQSSVEGPRGVLLKGLKLRA